MRFIEVLFAGHLGIGLAIIAVAVVAVACVTVIDPSTGTCHGR